MHRLLLFPLAISSLIADTPTVAVGDKYEHRIGAIATDAAGNSYATGSRVLRSAPSTGSIFPTEKPEVFIAKLDPANQPVWTQYFSGKEVDSGSAIAIDRDGSVYVAGYTTSLNFPLRNPLQTTPAAGFVLKLAADASRVLWSTYYGVAGTRIASLAVAPDGTLVLAGSIIKDSFYNTQAFVSKLDPVANKVAWEQQFGGSQLACGGGSSCFLSARNNNASIALDAAGNIYAAGNSNTLDFPTTPGALLEKGYGPYVRKFSPAGTVLWSTYLTTNRVGVGYPVSPADILSAVAAGSDGSVYIAGGGSPHWPTTPGAYRTAYEGPDWPQFGPAGPLNPYIAKLNASGTSILYSSFIGHNDTRPTSLAVDLAGNAFVSGGAYVNPAADYLLGLNAAGSSTVLDSTYANGSRGTAIALDASGRLHAAGASGVVTVVDRTPPSSGLSGVANAAGPAVAGRVAAGELISIYGWNLGNQVFVDELPAFVLYTSATQVNAIVPFGALGRERVTVSVRRNGVDTAKAVLAITDAQPEIFKLPTGQAAALNSDGTVNTKENPAQAGSVVSVFGTGASNWPLGTRDGSVNPLSPLVYVSVGAVAGNQAYTPVPFAGAAPGLVAGVFQINVQLPPTVYPPELGTVDIRAVVAYEMGAPAFVYVKQ